MPRSNARVDPHRAVLRHVVPDGSRVETRQVYAEVEVMTTLVLLRSTATGAVRFVQPEGAMLHAGDLIATVTGAHDSAASGIAPATPRAGAARAFSNRS